MLQNVGDFTPEMEALMLVFKALERDGKSSKENCNESFDADKSWINSVSREIFSEFIKSV